MDAKGGANVGLSREIMLIRGVIKCTHFNLSVIGGRRRAASGGIVERALKDLFDYCTRIEFREHVRARATTVG